MLNKRKLTIVMVTYNSFPFFKDSTDLLVKHIKDIELEIIIVDNNSNQLETLEYLDILDKEDNNFKIVKLARNGGYSTAMNIGINYASNEFVLTHDNDIFVDVNANEYYVEMYDLLEKNLDYGLISPLFVKEDGSPDINFFINFDVLNMVYQRISRIFSDKSKYDSLEELNKLDIDENSCVSVKVISGQFFLMRKSVYFNILGGWDTRYFLGISDTDVCEKMNFYGLRNILYTKGKLVHGVSKTNNDASFIVTFEFFKSFLQFMLKWRFFPFLRSSIYKVMFTIPTWMEILFRRINGNKNVSD